MIFFQGPDSFEYLIRDDLWNLQLWVRWGLPFEVFLDELFVGFRVLFLFNEKRLVFFCPCFFGEKWEIELSLDILGVLCSTLRWRRGKRRWRKVRKVLWMAWLRYFFEFLWFFMLLDWMLRMLLLRFLIVIAIIIIVFYPFYHWTLARIKNGIPLWHYLLVLGTFDIHRILWIVLILHANNIFFELKNFFHLGVPSHGGEDISSCFLYFPK